MVESGAKFKCNFSKTKSKFYRVANSILCKLGNCDNASATVSLMSSIALPILMYAVESLALNKSELNLLDHPLCRIFEKIFKTFDKNVIKQCRLYMGNLSFHQYYSLRVMSFLLGLSTSSNILLRFIYQNSGHEDIVKLANRYECTSEIFFKDYREIILDEHL